MNAAAAATTNETPATRIGRVVRVTVPADERGPAFEAECIRLIDATDTRPEVILFPRPDQRLRPIVAQLAAREDGTQYPPNERTLFVIVRAGHEAEDFDAVCPSDPDAPLYWIREGRTHVNHPASAAGRLYGARRGHSEGRGATAQTTRAWKTPLAENTGFICKMPGDHERRAIRLTAPDRLCRLLFLLSIPRRSRGMRLNSLFVKAAVLSGIGALAFGATAAQAAPFTINMISTAEQVLAGTFAYRIDLAVNESLVNGDFISLMDFGTFTNATSTQAGFVFTNPNLSPTALAGPTPGLLAPPPGGADDPNVGNLVATYTGGTITGVSFDIQATSPLTGLRSDFSYGQTSDLTGTTQGKINTTSAVAVPGAAQQVIPEPGTMALLGMGALGALGMVRRRRRAA